MEKRKRTRLIRGLGWFVGTVASVAAMVVLAIAAYLALFDYPEMLRAGLERELAAVSGRNAKVGSIDLSLPSYTVELRDIVVESEIESEPTLSVRSIRGQLSLLAILQQELYWNELVVDGLSLRLVEQTDGVLSLVVGDDARPLPTTRLTVGAENVSFTNASLILDNENVPWRLEADDLSVAIERAGFDRYHGKLLYESGHLTIKDHRTLDASLSVDFELSGRELYIKDSVAISTFGQVRAVGKVGFAGSSRGRFELEADGDIGPAAATILGLSEAESIAQGQAEFRGTLTVEPDNKILEGTLLLPDGAVRGFPLSDWRGEVFWDRSLLQLSYAAGQLAGGRARLQFHQPLPVSENEAALELDLERASLGTIARALGAMSPLQSTVSGRAGLRFHNRSMEGLRGEFEFRGADPSGGTSSDGLSFAIRGELDSGQVELEDASFDTRGLTASLSGLYPGGNGVELLLEATATSLPDADRMQRQLRALLGLGGRAEDGSGAAGGPSQLGFESGRARARGSVRGLWPRLVFDGEVTAEDVRLRGTALDNVRFRGTVAERSFAFEDAVATRHDGTLVGSGRIDLPVTSVSDLLLDLSLSQWPTRELFAGLGVAVVADTEVEVGGALTGDLSLRRGPESRLSGEADLEMSEAVIVGIPFDGGQARLTLAGRQLRADSFRLRRGGAELEGALEADLDGGGLTGAIETANLPLGGMALFGLPLDGQVESRAELGGTLSAPVVTIAGRGRYLSLGEVAIGEAFVSGSLREGEANLQVTVERVASNLVLDADVVMGGDYPASGTLSWRDLDLAPWLIGQQPSIRLSSTGEARFVSARGFSEPLASAEVEATLSEVNVEGDSFRFASVEPVEIVVRDRKLTLAPVPLIQGASRVSVGGEIDFAESSVDLVADGIVSLGVLESLNRNVRGTGDVRLEARLLGEWRGPSLTGFAELRHNSVRLADFPQALGGLSGRIVFDNRTIHFEDVRGVFGSGPVSIRGDAVLEGRQLGSIDLALEAEGVRIRYPEGLVATADADLSLAGPPDGRILAGSVRLRDAVWSREYELVAGILSDQEETILFQEFEEQDLLAGLQFDIEISAEESLRLRNSVAAIDASARLSLRGTVREPVILGSSEAVRGELYFLGQRYDLMSGRVDFVDPESVEPFIDVAAEARVRSYRVELRLIGTPQRFQPELSSDPPLRTVEILRLLAGASERQLDLRGNEEEELAGVGVASLLTERLTQEVGRRAERLFGLDRFSIDPFLVGKFANPTARMSLGKRITPELFVNYSTNLNATAEAIVLIEYTPEGPMTWILSRDEDGDVGIDVKFRKSF